MEKHFSSFHYCFARFLDALPLFPSLSAGFPAFNRRLSCAHINVIPAVFAL